MPIILFGYPCEQEGRGANHRKHHFEVRKLVKGTAAEQSEEAGRIFCPTCQQDTSVSQTRQVFGQSDRANRMDKYDRTQFCGCFEGGASFRRVKKTVSLGTVNTDSS